MHGRSPASPEGGRYLSRRGWAEAGWHWVKRARGIPGFGVFLADFDLSRCARVWQESAVCWQAKGRLATLFCRTLASPDHPQTVRPCQGGERAQPALALASAMDPAPDGANGTAEAAVAQIAHSQEPVWKQTQSLGYHVCGINGCVLADRHPGACIFPELISNGRRRRSVIATDDAPTGEPAVQWTWQWRRGSQRRPRR